MTDEPSKKLKQLDFREVLDLVRTGDPAAREELFERLASEKTEGGLLLSMARRLIPRNDRLRDLVETRDLVQSALRSGWINLYEFRGNTPGEFLNWIRTILRRKFSKAIRKLRERLDVEKVDPGRSWMIDRSMDIPIGNLIRDEVRIRVRQAIENLPMEQRSVIELRLQGFTGPEIAEKLGLHPATVRKRVSRALLQLRGLLEIYALKNL